MLLREHSDRDRTSLSGCCVMHAEECHLSLLRIRGSQLRRQRDKNLHSPLLAVTPIKTLHDCCSTAMKCTHAETAQHRHCGHVVRPAYIRQHGSDQHSTSFGKHPGATSLPGPYSRGIVPVLPLQAHTLHVQCLSMVLLALSTLAMIARPCW